MDKKENLKDRLMDELLREDARSEAEDEKLLAAVRGGIRKALIPEENVKDLADIPENIKNSIEIAPVKWIDQVLMHALETAPEPLGDLPKTQSPKVAGSDHPSAEQNLRAH